jgi:hypothetical protein
MLAGPTGHVSRVVGPATSRPCVERPVPALLKLST